MTDRKKPTTAFWISVALVMALVGYPLSFGPACWLASRTGTGTAVEITYYPLAWIWGFGPDPLKDVFWWYAHVGAIDDWMIAPTVSAGTRLVVIPPLESTAISHFR